MIKILLVVVVMGTTAFAADWVVSPKGNDSAAGTEAAPFATVGRAIRAIREARAKSQPKAETVLLRAGVYELPETISLQPADSESTIASWPGEAVTITGGRRLSGFQVAGGRWVLDIQEAKGGKWKFSQLFVNGSRRFRARANGGKYLHIATTAPTNEAYPGEGDNRFGYAGDDVQANWKNLGDVEALLFHRWTMSRLPIDSVDEAKKVVSLRGRTMHADAAKLQKGTRYLLENVHEALSRPGEWYLDRTTGRLEYIPMPGEDPATAEVYAPRVETLVSIVGEKNHPVTNITLRGVAFEHSNWNMPQNGHATGQAEMPVRGAIRATAASFVTLDNISVCEIGHYAIDFGEMCSDCTITNCDLFDLGAGGIRCGTGWDEGDSREKISSNFTITNNRIYGIGRMHPGAIGIWIGHSPHNVVSHNEIFDTYYTGISIGWRWGAGFSWAHHNTIAHNLIHHIGQGRLDDMGGVYTLGESPGTMLQSNLIHDVRRVNYGGNGIYLDEGSAGILVENNIAYNCEEPAFFMHYGTNNIVRNNILAHSAKNLVGSGRPDKSGPMTFQHNVMIGSNPSIMMPGYSNDRATFDHNIYWCDGGKAPVFPGNADFEQWQKKGQDTGSIVADPGWKDGDMTNEDVAKKVGFQTFEIDAGREKTALKLPATRPVVEGYPAP